MVSIGYCRQHLVSVVGGVGVVVIFFHASLWRVLPTFGCGTVVVVVRVICVPVVSPKKVAAPTEDMLLPLLCCTSKYQS